MGKREEHLTALINFLFAAAFVHNEDDGVWELCEFLWIDGSLFYRAFDWTKTGTTWGDYTAAVCKALDALISRCPRLRVVVYSIDKYGFSTLPPMPKEPTQGHRYEGHKAVPCPDQVYCVEQSVAGISSTDTFGDMRARMAFNAMISRELIATLGRFVHSADSSVELAILDGAVTKREVDAVERGDHTVRDTPAPLPEPDSGKYLVYRPYSHVMRNAYQDPIDEWNPHSEGDIAAAHWLGQFCHLNSVICSCDVDLQQVVLQVIRRLADGGMRPEQLPRIHIFKKVNALVQTFDMKVYFRQVCSTIQPLLAPDDPSHPVDVWFALTAISGNDFCAPWLSSAECIRGEKMNDGVRLQAVWTAFVLHAKKLGPLFMPVTQADRRDGGEWSRFRLPTWVYPMEMRVQAWRALLDEACSIQLQRTALKIASHQAMLDNRQYVQGQLRRIAWALSYYANAALLRDQMPRGIETDPAGLSLHGWMITPEGKTVITNRVPTNTETVCGLRFSQAPTPPFTPAHSDRDPLEVFYELCDNMD